MSTTPSSMFDYLDTVATIASGLVAGSFFYMSFGQAPALREFGLNEHWRFFPHMLHKAVLPLPSLAITAGVAGILHGTRIHGLPFDRNLWILAGTTCLAIVPYTIIFMAPTVKAITDDNKAIHSGSESQFNMTTKKELLDKWIGFHLIRTVSCIASFGAMAYGLSRHSSFVLTW